MDLEDQLDAALSDGDRLDVLRAQYDRHVKRHIEEKRALRRALQRIAKLTTLDTDGDALELVWMMRDIAVGAVGTGDVHVSDGPATNAARGGTK